MPVTISRSGKCPWRTNRARPSAVSLSAWSPRKPATSASTACANSARAPLRKISVNGSLKVPGCASLITLSWVTAYHSFGGEVEAFEHPHDTPPHPFIPSPTFAHSSPATTPKCLRPNQAHRAGLTVEENMGERLPGSQTFLLVSILACGAASVGLYREKPRVG